MNSWLCKTEAVEASTGSFWHVPVSLSSRRMGSLLHRWSLGPLWCLYSSRGQPCCLGRTKEGVGMRMGKIMAFLNQGRFKVLTVLVLGTFLLLPCGDPRSTRSQRL